MKEQRLRRFFDVTLISAELSSSEFKLFGRVVSLSFFKVEEELLVFSDKSELNMSVELFGVTL